MLILFVDDKLGLENFRIFSFGSSTFTAFPLFILKIQHYIFKMKLWSKNYIILNEPAT